MGSTLKTHPEVIMKTMYEIKPHPFGCGEGRERPSFVFDKKTYELRGGSANPSETLEFKVNEIVLIEDDFIVTRHMASYYWWVESSTDATYYSDAYCRAYGVIQELKLVDSGYPLYELKKELALINECRSLDDVRFLKRHHATDIKWHNVRWQKWSYSDCGEDHVTWALIPISSDGSPKVEPKFLYRYGYWEWGSHYAIEEEIE